MIFKIAQLQFFSGSGFFCVRRHCWSHLRSFLVISGLILRLDLDRSTSWLHRLHLGYIVIMVSIANSTFDMFWGCKDSWGLSPFWVALIVGLISLLAIFWLVERRRRVVLCAARDDAVSFCFKYFSLFCNAEKKLLGNKRVN